MASKESDSISRLKAIFPQAVQDGQIDFDKLKELLGQKNLAEEKFGLFWRGKSEAYETTREPSKATLKYESDLSYNDNDNTDNMIITGDNLEVLKVLCNSYTNKIKMIYIDPPYNTGKDFIYRDKFSDTLANYMEYTDGNYNTEGETSGRKHSNWLSMMYPRLVIARYLLKDDGVIFISIDDNEQARLKLLCDEVFGEDNFIGDLIRKTKSTTNDADSGFNMQHDTILIYAKNKDSITMQGEEKTFENYKNPDDDPQGVWTNSDPSTPTGSYYEVVNPYTGKVDLPPVGRFWSFPENRFEDHVESGKIVFKTEYKENERGFIFKRYKNEIRSFFHVVNSLDLTLNEFMNQKATKELVKTMGNKVFSYNKGEKILEYLISTVTKPEDTVLDFFAGSGTTGVVAAKMNRKFILVQLPEIITEKLRGKINEAYKAGYRTIDQITRDRVKKSIEKDNLKSSFKAFSLVANIFPYENHANGIDLEQPSLYQPITENSNYNILIAILLRIGQFDKLNYFKTITIANINFYYHDKIYICTHKEFIGNNLKDVLRDLAENIDIIIFLEICFNDDMTKLNLIHTLKSFNENITIEVI